MPSQSSNKRKIRPNERKIVGKKIESLESNKISMNRERNKFRIFFSVVGKGVL